MYAYPIILGQQPFLHDTRLGNWNSFAMQVLYDLWFIRLQEIIKDRHFSDFILLIKEERSYKNCSGTLTHYMLYKLPFETHKISANSKIGKVFLNDTFHFIGNKHYITSYFNFSESNLNLVQIITKEGTRRICLENK